MHRCMIVVPCYNEAARLDVDALSACVCNNPQVSFLLVDDGSTDGTSEILDRLVASNPERFVSHRLSQNMGKAEAVRRGMLWSLATDVDAVGYWDADLSTPLDELGRFHKVLADHSDLQMVMGARVKLLGHKIDRRPLRHFVGRVFATMASLVLNIPVYDTQCGAKLFRASAEIRGIFSQRFISNWIFDVELIARLLSNQQKKAMGQDVKPLIREIPLREWRDVPGSKLRFFDYFRAVSQLIQIYFTYFRPPIAADKVNSRAEMPASASLPSERVIQGPHVANSHAMPCNASVSHIEHGN